MITLSNKQPAQLTEAIRYRNTTAKQATILLEKLFSAVPEEIQNAQRITILVIGAGSFPSYTPLVAKLSSILPLLEEINFTLIEPNKNETDLFENHFAALPDNKNIKKLRIHFNIDNVSIKDFLFLSTPTLFDLAYFEHPETMTLPILLAKFGMRRFNRVISLRESIPSLARVLKPHAFIIASCMSKHELLQIKLLLQFSLNAHSKLVSSFNPIDYFFGGPYSSGLIYRTNKLPSNSLLQEKRAKTILKSDNYLCVFVLLSFVIYCFKSTGSQQFSAQIISILLMGAQLFLHRPGKSGLLIKVLLLMGQMAL